MSLRAFLTTLTLSAVAATGAYAQDDAAKAAIKARQAQMDLYAFNLGALGAMAKGAVAYDADAASKAAGNLAMLTKMDQSRMWPEGSDDMSADNTRALPAMWENMGDVMAKGGDLAKAAAAMEAAAGNGLESLQAAMGPLGGACGACHKAYRAPES